MFPQTFTDCMLFIDFATRRHEVLFNQLESYRSYILGVLENVSGEEADEIPKGFNNKIRWNLGHIYLDQYLWILMDTYKFYR
jgi:hypothetical protein